MGNVTTSGPNEVKIISGSWSSSDSKKYIVGGWGWAWWCVSNVEDMNLNVMTLKPICNSVETAKGVPLSITAVAQVKINYNKADCQLLTKACEHFSGRTQNEIKGILTQTMEGHLRAILGQMTVEQVYKDREVFAEQVRDTATPDIAKMGVTILSFVIQDLSDDVEYLSSIGISQIADVKRDADIAEQTADKDTKIIQAQCDQELVETEMKCYTIVDITRKEFETCQADCQTKVNKATTDASCAFDLQRAKEMQEIANAEATVKIVTTKKEAEIQKAEVLRKELELVCNDKLPAKFNAQKMETIAEGQRIVKVLTAEAEAQKVRLIGTAEANSINAIGQAEASAMQSKAEAMGQYGKQALVQMVLDSLSPLAAELAAPLSKVDQVVIMGGTNDRVSTQVGQLISEGPAVINALTGVDVSNSIRKIPGFA